MGYQNVATPRFYIDYLQYAKAVGNKDTSTDHSKHIGLNSSGRTYTTTSTAGEVWISPRFINPLPLPRPDIVDGSSTSSGMFAGCLGHSASSAYAGGMSLDFSIPDSEGNSTYSTNPSSGSLPINWEAHDTPVLLDGFTLLKKTILPTLVDIKGLSTRFWIGTEAATSIDLFVKSLVFGQYFNCPVSPDLSLTMSHEYDGIKTITTKGGSTLSNVSYYKPPKWEDNLEAWELKPASGAYSSYDYGYQSSSRRIWDLSFSYISDSDIEPYNYYGVQYSTETGGSSISEGNDNWFSNVLYYTMGGHLPFIFCPDPNIEYTPFSDGTVPPRVPEFAICRFDMNTFKRTQVAHKMYTISVKLRETW